MKEVGAATIEAATRRVRLTAPKLVAIVTIAIAGALKRTLRARFVQGGDQIRESRDRDRKRRQSQREGQPCHLLRLARAERLQQEIQRNDEQLMRKLYTN